MTYCLWRKFGLKLSFLCRCFTKFGRVRLKDYLGTLGAVEVSFRFQFVNFAFFPDKETFCLGDVKILFFQTLDRYSFV